MVEAAASRAPLTIDVVTDIVCPWCLIGTEHLTRALDARRDIDVRLRLHPFLLDPSIPEGGRDLRAYLAKKYGADPERMFEGVVRAGRASGIAFDFSGQPSFASSVRAHALVAYAESKDRAWPVHRALMEANFVTREDISHDDVLARVARTHGLDVDQALAETRAPAALGAVRERARQASIDGVTGVPFFVFGDALGFSGAQPVSVFEEVIDRVLAGTIDDEARANDA